MNITIVENVKKSRVRVQPKIEKMVLEAITFYNEQKGSSVQSIKKYITSNFSMDLKVLAPHLKKFLHTAIENGVLQQTSGKGATGKFRIPKKKIAKDTKLIQTAKTKGNEKSIKIKTLKEPLKVRVPKAKSAKVPILVTKSPMLPKARKSPHRPPKVLNAKSGKTPAKTKKLNHTIAKTRKPPTPKVVNNSKKDSKTASNIPKASKGPSTSTPHIPAILNKRKNTTRATVSTKAGKKTPKGKGSSRPTKPSTRVSPDATLIPEVNEEPAADNAPGLVESPIQKNSSQSSGSESSDDTNDISTNSRSVSAASENSTTNKGMRSYYSMRQNTRATKR